jgi:hypothetical protein
LGVWKPFFSSLLELVKFISVNWGAGRTPRKLNRASVSAA